MASEDRCVLCGAIIPEGYGHVCPDCLRREEFIWNEYFRSIKNDDKSEADESCENRDATQQKRRKLLRDSTK